MLITDVGRASSIVAMIVVSIAFAVFAARFRFASIPTGLRVVGIALLAIFASVAGHWVLGRSVTALLLFDQTSGFGRSYAVGLGILCFGVWLIVIGVLARMYDAIKRLVTTKY